MLKLFLLKGPLPPEMIGEIARLYGKYDSNYASPSFCEHLFNQNPLGYSYHAFIKNFEKVVGHYGMIPSEISVKGQKMVSLKGEAFVVEKEQPVKTILFEEKKIPLGYALSKGLTDYAFSQQDVSLIHLMSPKSVARIHQRSGCKEKSISETFFSYLIRV